MSSHQKGLLLEFFVNSFFKHSFGAPFAFATMAQQIHVLADHLLRQDLCQSYQTTIVSWLGVFLPSIPRSYIYTQIFS